MRLTRRSGLGALAALCPSVPLPARADTGHEGLATLVAEYETATAHLMSLWDDGGQCIHRTDWQPATAECGRLRAAIALHPVASLADVMLKVRACAAHDHGDDAEDLAATIKGQRGHAYHDDVTSAVVIGLLQLREAGLCA